MTAAAEFAKVLDEELEPQASHVRYDADRRSGFAYFPNIGSIEFRESANDPAVIITIQFPKRFKGSADSAIEFLRTLSAAWSNSD